MSDNAPSDKPSTSAPAVVSKSASPKKKRPKELPPAKVFYRDPKTGERTTKRPGKG